MRLDLELYREEMEVAPGITISYIDIAPERPLRTYLLIHGFGGNALQWQYQIEAFSQHNRVVALDLRGHGQSSAPPSGYDMQSLVSDIVTVMDGLHLHHKIILAGHSFGVALVTELASSHSHRFSHLVLIAGAGEYQISRLYRLVFLLPDPLLATAQPWVGGFIDASLPALKEMYHASVRRWSGWDKFPHLRMPVLVILGNRDKVLPQEAFERVAQLVPAQSSEVISVDVSAHMVMLERRSAVNRAIARFVDLQLESEQAPRWRTRFDPDSRGSMLRERPWLASYETEVPATIHVPEQTVTRLLTRAARRFPRSLAVAATGTSLTYKTLREQSARFANALLSGLNLPQGARVLLLLPNLPHLLVAYYGTLAAAGVVVMVNPQAPESEVIRQAQETGAVVMVTRPAYAALAVAVYQQSAVQHIVFASSRDYQVWYHRLRNFFKRSKPVVDYTRAVPPDLVLSWPKWLRKFSTDQPVVPVEPGDLALIQYTGGTAGKPKGVMLSHRNLLANTIQVQAWMSDAEDGVETFLSVTPLSHMLGLITAANVPVSLAATMVLLPRFQIKEVLEAIRTFEPTFFPGVPAMYLAINGYPNVRKYNVQSIRACLSSGAPLPIEVEEAFEKLAKARLVEGYGLTEAGALTHCSPLFGRDKIGSIGLPLPSTEARIVDLRTRRPLAPGEVGELAVRGPQVMIGYWRDEEATRAVLDKHGWLYTGDIARMDEDGYFQIISRSHEIGRSKKGDDIFPRDIEEILYELPAVDEPIVVIIAGRPVAFVRLKENAHISADTILAFAQRRLPTDHVPWRVIFVSEFPRSLLGRVLRRELVDTFEDKLEVGAGGAGRHLPGLQGPLELASS